jgi:hypothetical protein
MVTASTLTWVALDLDEQGWSELTELQASTHYRVEEIRKDAASRIAEI